MKKLFLCIACIVVILALTGGAGAAKMVVPDYRNRILISNATELEDYSNEYNESDLLPNVPLDGDALVSDGNVDKPVESHSLLEFIPYNASERNQGNTGTCWVWAGTALLEASLAYRNGYPDRLSTQYFASWYHLGGGAGIGCFAGNGGTPEKFAGSYNAMNAALPWNNTNASWQDGGVGEAGPSSVPLSDITQLPNYDLDGGVKLYVIRTTEDNDADAYQAMANIKSLIDANRPVFLSIHGDKNYMNDFIGWYDNNPESDIYDFSWWNGHTVNTDKGHAVTVVGYRDDGTFAGSYWLCLNSWGNSTKRPHGLFRVQMYMNYEAEGDPGFFYYNIPVTTWWSLAFNGGGSDKAFTQYAPSTRNFTVNLRDPVTQKAEAVVDPGGIKSCYFTVTDWGYPTSGHIDYGDGTSDGFTEASPPQTGANRHVFYHNYAPGTFYPVYYATNAVGDGAIVPLEGTPLVIQGHAPNAWFQCTFPKYCPVYQNPPATIEVHFNSQSQYSPTSWTWDFGDGSLPDNAEDPVHVYAHAGDYDVTLTVQNAHGSNSTTVPVHAYAKKDCHEVFGVSPKEAYHVWKPFYSADDLSHYTSIMVTADEAVTHPIDLDTTRVRKIDMFPAEVYEEYNEQVIAAGYGAAVPEISAGTDSSAGPDLALPVPVLSKTRLTPKPGVNKTVKARIDTTHMKPGLYTYNLVAKDYRTHKTISRTPMYFMIEGAPKVRVKPASVSLGTIGIGDTTPGTFTVENTGNVPLTCTLTAPPEYVLSGGAESPVTFTVAPWASIPVTFRIDTKYRAQEGPRRSKLSSLALETNDPAAPLIEIPVSYKLEAPMAEFVAMDIPDQIVDAISHDPSVTVNITMKNVGKDPWTNAYRLGVPDFGDGALFVSANSAGEGIVPVGKNATYQLVLHPLGNSSAYGNYTLAFEMYYPGAHGTPVFFGSPVFKEIHYGPSI